MGWFSSTPAPPTPKISADGTPEAPGRTQRARCWEARDEYFKCLDKSDILDAIKDKEVAAKKCGPEGKAFESNCASSWVTYFKNQRVFEDKKAKAMKKLEAEGATALPPGATPMTRSGP